VIDVSFLGKRARGKSTRDHWQALWLSNDASVANPFGTNYSNHLKVFPIEIVPSSHPIPTHFVRQKMSAFNLSATLNIFRVLRNPSLLYPHMTINTFNQLPIPLTVSVPFGNSGIRAIVLDKDNCFAAAQASSVYPAYNVM
jgi:hypothetical protein